MSWALFLNPYLLLGLGGIALPVIAHLLSRRKYDVVEWGAMQFLNPSRKSRRKMRLEELLLLLVRIFAIALIALALARPTINSGFLMGYRSGGSRDVVIVIDGSNSMARTDGMTSLHHKAIRRAKQLLETLQPGDTVAVIDARDLPIKVIDSPVQDRTVVAAALDNLPPPSGAASLRQACEDAIGLLGRCSNAAREVVVFTDRQRNGWSIANESAWKRFDEMLNFPSVRPNVWVIDVAQGLAELQQNVSVGEVDIERALTVPDFPVSFQVAIRNASGLPVEVPVQVLLNGQRIASLDATVSVPAKSESLFSRTLRFNSEGTNLITVKAVVEKDSIIADNESHAAIRVTSTIPVLLVEGNGRASRARRNSFFAELALSPPQNDTPWILARTVKAEDLQTSDLENVGAIILADVASLPAQMADSIREFVSRGNGAFITVSENSSPEAFQSLYVNSGLLPPIQLSRIRKAEADASIPTTIAPYSLEASWLDRFRERKGATLLTAVFKNWWLITTTNATSATEASPNIDSTNPQAGPAVQDTPATANTHSVSILGQLISGDPLLLKTSCGEGDVMLMTSSLNTSWNTLPTQPDYVPFLHEILFQLVSSKVRRNVPFGSALLTTTNDPAAVKTAFEFTEPFNRRESALVSTQGNKTVVQLPRTRLPGVYLLNNSSDPDARSVDTFVVNYDHAEDDPLELTQDDFDNLVANERMSFVGDPATLAKEMYGDESTSDLWWLLLFVFLGLLMLEAWMTRRLVLQGHADSPLAAPQQGLRP